MTRLAQLLHYTSLSQALFSKPLSPIGPTQPSRGNVTRRIACWTFQDGHLVSFYFFCFFFWFVSFHTFPCCPLSTVSLYKLQYCLSLAFVFYICYFWFVLIIVQPPTPLSLPATAAACVWLSSVQVATAYRWDVYPTWDARRITNTLLSCHLLLLQ